MSFFPSVLSCKVTNWLFLGGIGTNDQLNIIKNSTDGATMIAQDQWINLPVGYNLNDHVGVSQPFFVTSGRPEILTSEADRY